MCVINELLDVAITTGFSAHSHEQVDIAEHLLSNYHVNPEEIAVITPYSAQKEEIKTKLKKRGVDGIAVKTITESQGVCVSILCILCYLGSSDLDFNLSK